LFAASNVLIVAGKGGVGKTTVGASLAIAAARSGCDALLVELEGHSTVGPLLGLDAIAYDEVDVPLDRFGSVPAGAGGLRARQISPDDALGDYLDKAGLGPVTSRLAPAGAMEVVVTAAPGIRDLVTLGKIRQLEQSNAADLIVVDAPAAGHALTFLTAPSGLADSTNAGPVRSQADQVLELFADADRCQVMLVTRPEETPVTETVETAFSLEEDVGIKLSPVVINACWPTIDGLEAAAESAAADSAAAESAAADGGDPIVAAARYRLARITDQEAEVRRLADELPLPQIRLPHLFTAGLGPTELGRLADALAAEAAPVS
jgi:anion-transporting  ArsA/GET3 family ATPase